MLISVVIPHFNQEAHLRTCLQRLHAQEGCRAEVEIIVVDNGSRQMPEAVCAAFPGVTLLRETTPGPGPARNLGASRAKGEILAFIDADCHADPHWLAEIERHFHNPEAQIAGGDVRVGYANPDRPTFLEPYEAIYSYRNHEHIAEGFSGTGNLATRAAILAHVGLFAGIGIAEDRDWGFRAKAFGYRTVYLPGMVVYHPARESFRELARKWDRHIAHDYADRVRGPLGRARWLVRAFAMAASPLAEIPTVMTSTRISGTQDRWFAFLCLCAVRLYRFRAMMLIPFRGADTERTAWRR